MPRKISRKIEQVLELPDGVLTGEAHIELSGSRRAVVDGCRGITEYSDDIVRLNTVGGILRLCGHELQIGYLNGDSVVVTGLIVSVEFL